MRIYLLLLFVLMITRAQATNVIFDRITMDSGLSSSSVTSILKDRTGYVWVGTTEGLNRYDGYTFKVFLPVPDCPESIQSSSTSHISIYFFTEKSRKRRKQTRQKILKSWNRSRMIFNIKICPISVRIFRNWKINTVPISSFQICM